MPEPALQVEEILSDIRQRVLDENGAVAVRPTDRSERGSDTSAIRIETYLKTTDQLRGSLPPVRSYRHGAKAKLEIWIKSKIRRATKWLFFDQVNFNSAVHQLLVELNALQLRQETIVEEFQRAVRLEAHQQEQRQQVFNEAQMALNEEQRLSNQRQLALNEQQDLVNTEQRRFNEEQRSLNNEQSVADEARSAAMEQLRADLSETAVVIDRLRRNFEHRLTRLESDDA